MQLKDASFARKGKSLIKNIPFSDAVSLTDLVDYRAGQVVSRTLAQSQQVNVTLFAFAEGEGLSTHHSTGDAMVQVLTGRGTFTIDGKATEVAAGQTIILPANIPHAVDAPESFKMLLTVVKPGTE